MSFREKWLEAVEQKNSVLCAGLDPAEFGMGRGESGLPKDKDKFFWAMDYVEAVAPYCAAVKTNVQYWKAPGDTDSLAIIRELVMGLDLIFIDDSKLADIGSTNDAGLYHAKEKGFDAVTLAPFAGNMKEAAEQAKKREIGLISMCLMSNQEYERVKNGLVSIADSADYDVKDIMQIDGIPHVRKYIQLAHDAAAFGIDGIVIGAPSKKNHITSEEIGIARYYSRENTLVLLPGVGAQGGEADAVWRYFGINKVIVNVGRALMFPEGSNSTPKQQAEAAKQYKEMLNNLRQAHL